MKSVEGLFYKYAEQDSNLNADRSKLMAIEEFRQSIAYHDKEIIQIIDDMVKAREKGILLLQSLPLQNPPQISTDEWILALTELKQKLMEKK